MINICVEFIEKGKEGVKVNCNGTITGRGCDIRREMVGALLMFDEVSDGEILCDALEEFLEQKMKGVKDDD